MNLDGHYFGDGSEIFEDLLGTGCGAQHKAERGPFRAFMRGQCFQHTAEVIEYAVDMHNSRRPVMRCAAQDKFHIVERLRCTLVGFVQRGPRAGFLTFHPGL